MKQLAVHYKNKYPGAQVAVYDDGLDVIKGDDHKVAIRKNGAGQFVCVSAEHGCSDKHDMSPIPKDARLYKVVDGKIAKDEKYDERSKMKDAFMDKSGKIKSCEELSKEGWSFDDKQKVISAPDKKA